ncbi:N-acetyltransferase [Shewanella morhuae]|uniref:N-acetyltransferase n=1 Tax=Shewanella morhuae TaxID=365591 RepID=A0ABX5HNS5_9GAMM|nr:GNAT family N-acetyltransferase [Shewanella morhuae]PTA48520.1 N-acetyltransferase [Shewanella morhuae]
MTDLQTRVQLRPYQQNDLPFLLQLYTSSRSHELEQAPFSSEQKTAFLAQQFAAQFHHYSTYYSTERFDIILIDKIAVGRLFVDHWTSEIRVVDISLLPEYQQQKIGTYLFQLLFIQSQQLQKPITIHVEQHNPARLWYEKLGFTYKSTTNEVYLLMERQPSLSPLCAC